MGQGRQRAGEARHKQQDHATELYIVAGLTVEEISEQLSIPIQTLKAWSKMANWVARRKSYRMLSYTWPERLRALAEKALQRANERLDRLGPEDDIPEKPLYAVTKLDERLHQYREKNPIDPAAFALKLIGELVAYLHYKDPIALSHLQKHLEAFAKKMKRHA